MGLFTKAYNEKNPDNQINCEESHLEDESNQKIFSNDIVESVLSDHSDYHLRAGAHVRISVVKIAEESNSKLRCRNYGCNQFYNEEENSDNACHHHTGPPIFHDTMKCWSCCRDRKAFDFEAFQLIKGCSTGSHSIIPPAVALAKSPSAVDNPVASLQPIAAPLKSIAAYNAANPEAASAATSAVKTMERKSTRKDDGTARCQRKGCQKQFVFESNEVGACQYHKGQPIFHDALKFWSCCPNKKCFDFDEFLLVPGCGTGFHDDGVIELLSLDESV